MKWRTVHYPATSVSPYSDCPVRHVVQQQETSNGQWYTVATGVDYAELRLTYRALTGRYRIIRGDNKLTVYLS